MYVELVPELVSNYLTQNAVLTLTLTLTLTSAVDQLMALNQVVN